MSTNPLIKLMRSLVGNEFLSFKGEEYEGIEDGSELKLGYSPMARPLNIKNYQESKLGDDQGIPSSSSTIIRSSSLNFIFITLHNMCYAWSIFFTFSFFVCWSYLCWILALRDTLRFFIWILLCFAYIFLSILSYCLFSSKLSLLAFILFRAASC